MGRNEASITWDLSWLDKFGRVNADSFDIDSDNPQGTIKVTIGDKPIKFNRFHYCKGIYAQYRDKDHKYIIDVSLSNIYQ